MPELLLSCQDLSKAFGAAPLFEGLSFGVFEGDHIGLVGPNGSGKSTLLKILTGDESPTAGTRSVRKRLRVGYVPQDPSFPSGTTVAGVLGGAAVRLGLDDHEAEVRVAMAMGRAGFADGEQPVATLSGGWKKRLAIVRELVTEPELLLLDEPTNHLDIGGILWLEELLKREPEAFVAVSHDRYFLEAVAGRVIELNRAFALGLIDVKGRYSHYLEKKDAQLAGQAAYQDSLRNRVRGEMEWLSRKAKARTRKAKARIDEAGRLRNELIDLDSRSRGSEVAIDFAGTERKTKRLLVARGLTKSFGPRHVVRGLDLLLAPGRRLGLLGANGSGKSTLLRLMAGSDAPDAGTIDRAPDLKVVMFDQHRARLDPNVSLRRTLAPSGDSVIAQGTSVHVAGWAKRFLFRPEQLETPVGRLSGGEQARVLIAKLMLEPADLLLLDEPTNDLDIPTLEVLEESLLEFPGALVLVTHDRYLLDRVSTELLALDGKGGAATFADYAQWELAQGEAAERAPMQASASSAGGSEDSQKKELFGSRPKPSGPAMLESGAADPGAAPPKRAAAGPNPAGAGRPSPKWSKSKPARSGSSSTPAHGSPGEGPVSSRKLSLPGAGPAVFSGQSPDTAAGSTARATSRPGIASNPAGSPKGRPVREATPAPPSAKPKRLGYLEQREWEQIESRVLVAEQHLAECQNAAADPAVVSDHQALSLRLAALSAAHAGVEQLYARWAELEAKVKG